LISKAHIKKIRSLGQKKYRYQHKLFVAEGDKLVDTFINSKRWEVKEIFAKKEWIKKQLSGDEDHAGNINEVSYEELKKISFLKTPHNVLALITLPVGKSIPPPSGDEWTLVLENIQDPGNLGTMIRIAAWFGISKVICSPDSVDVFNPKVIQASMGALTLVDVFYTGLDIWLHQANNQGIPVYGTILDGEDIFASIIEKKGVILLGNESKGISPVLTKVITYPLTIPGRQTASMFINSLNLSTAAAIVCAELTRKIPA